MFPHSEHDRNSLVELVLQSDSFIRPSLKLINLPRQIRDQHRLLVQFRFRYSKIILALLAGTLLQFQPRRAKAGTLIILTGQPANGLSRREA